MAALALVCPAAAMRTKRSSGRKSTAPSPIPDQRFQGDEQWQRDFARLCQLDEECREHAIAGHQLLEHGAVDAARHELALADEDQEVIECLIHALRYMDDRPC